MSRLKPLKRHKPNPKMAEIQARIELAETIANVHKIAVATSLMAIRDEFGFGHDRMKRIVTRMKGYHEAIERGDLSFEDIVETLGDEVGKDILE